MLSKLHALIALLYLFLPLLLLSRDTANGTYTPFAYFMAKSLASMPFQHLPLTAVLVISYWMSGESRARCSEVYVLSPRCTYAV